MSDYLIAKLDKFLDWYLEGTWIGPLVWFMVGIVFDHFFVEW